jgi:hypothetical protein
MLSQWYKREIIIIGLTFGEMLISQKAYTAMIVFSATPQKYLQIMEILMSGKTQILLLATSP